MKQIGDGASQDRRKSQRRRRPQLRLAAFEVVDRAFAHRRITDVVLIGEFGTQGRQTSARQGGGVSAVAEIVWVGSNRG